MSGPSLSGGDVLSPATHPDQTDLGAKFTQLLMELNQTHQQQVTGLQQRCQELDRSRKHYYLELKKTLGVKNSLKRSNQQLQEELESLKTSASKDACKNCLSLQRELQQKEEELQTIRLESEQYVRAQEAQMKELQNRLAKLLSIQASHKQGHQGGTRTEESSVKGKVSTDNQEEDAAMTLEQGGQPGEVTSPDTAAHDAKVTGTTKQAASRLHRQNKRVRYKENVKTSPELEEGRKLNGPQRKPLVLGNTQGEFTQQMRMCRVLVPDTLAVEASTESETDDQKSSSHIEQQTASEHKSGKQNGKGRYHKGNCRKKGSSADEIIQEEDPSDDPITMIPETMAVEEDLDETGMLMSPPGCSSTPFHQPATVTNQNPPRSVATNQQPESSLTKDSTGDHPDHKEVSKTGSLETDLSPPVSPTFGRPAGPTVVSTPDVTCESPLLFGENLHVGTRVEEEPCHQKNVPTSQEIKPIRKASRSTSAGSPALRSPLVLRIKTEPLTQADSDVSPLLLGMPKLKVKQEVQGHDPTRLTLQGEFDNAAAGVGPGNEVEGELEDAEYTLEGLSTKRKNRSSQALERRATRRSSRTAVRETEVVRSSPRIKNSQHAKKNSRGGKRKTCFDDTSDLSEEDISDTRARGKRVRNSRKVASSQAGSKQKGGVQADGSPGLKQLTLTQAMFIQKTELHRSNVFQGGLRKKKASHEDSDLQQALELSKKETSPRAAEEEEAVRLAVQRSMHDITNTREPPHRAHTHGGARTQVRAGCSSNMNPDQAMEDTFDPDSTFLPGKFKVPGTLRTSTQKDTQFQSQQYTNGPLNGSLDPDIQLTEFDTTTLPVDSQGPACGNETRGRRRKRSGAQNDAAARGKTDISRLFDETEVSQEAGDRDRNPDTPEVVQKKKNVGKNRRKEAVEEDSDSCSDLFEDDEMEEWEGRAAGCHGDGDDDDDDDGGEWQERREGRVAGRRSRDVPDTIAEFDRVPRKDNSPNYKYAKVVRKKQERRKLHGHDCDCCKEWYGDMTESQKKLRMKASSRHRKQHAPTSTPPHFWDLGMEDTQLLKERGYLKQTQVQPPRKRRRRPYKQNFSPAKRAAGQDD